MTRVTITATTPRERYAEWWRAAKRGVTWRHSPMLTRLLDAGEADAELEQAETMRTWASSLPGWTIDTPHRSLRHPLRFSGITGSPKRNGTGRAVTVRLQPDEYAALDAEAERRGVSLAELLRTAGMETMRRKR